VIVDVSEALHKMLSTDVEPRLDVRLFEDANIFRRNYIYVEPVDTVLRRHEPSLRLIYERATKLRGTNMGAGIGNQMVSFTDWKDLCRHFCLYDGDTTEREVTLSFVWSRMRVVDEDQPRSRACLTHLAFEDFLEAICRLAALKVFPTESEMEEAGTTNPGVFLLKLKRELPERYYQMLRERRTPWGGSPPPQLERAIDYMCQYLIAMIEGEKGSGKLTAKEVRLFLKSRDKE